MKLHWVMTGAHWHTSKQYRSKPTDGSWYRWRSLVVRICSYCCGLWWPEDLYHFRKPYRKDNHEIPSLLTLEPVRDVHPLTIPTRNPLLNEDPSLKPSLSSQLDHPLAFSNEKAKQEQTRVSIMELWNKEKQEIIQDFSTESFRINACFFSDAAAEEKGTIKYKFACVDQVSVIQ